MENNTQVTGEIISYRSFPLFVTDQFSVAPSVLRKMFAVVQLDIMHSPGWGMKSRSSFLKHVDCLVARAMGFRKTINFYYDGHFPIIVEKYHLVTRPMVNHHRC